MYVALLLLEFSDDLQNFWWHFYSTLNSLKLIRNKKVMRFESKRGQNQEEKKKYILQFGKNVFSLLLFFGLPLLGFAFQR